MSNVIFQKLIFCQKLTSAGWCQILELSHKFTCFFSKFLCFDFSRLKTTFHPTSAGVGVGWCREKYVILSDKSKDNGCIRETIRMYSGVLQVAHGGSGAKAPPLAARTSTVQETSQIPDCGFYLPVFMCCDATVNDAHRSLSYDSKVWSSRGSCNTILYKLVH